LSKLWIQTVDGGVVFKAKIVPGSSKTAICGLLDDMLKVKIAAPPEKGKANVELVGFLAKQLGVKKNAISVISGKTNPVKEIEVLGINGETLVEKLHI
jgi:uncharacterized protein